MKRIKKYLIMLSLIAVTIFLRHSCTVQAAQEDDIFKELYMEYRSVLSNQRIDIYRIKQIDKDSHTYIISGTCKLRPGVQQGIGGVVTVPNSPDKGIPCDRRPRGKNKM